VDTPSQGTDRFRRAALNTWLLFSERDLAHWVVNAPLREPHHKGSPPPRFFFLSNERGRFWRLQNTLPPATRLFPCARCDDFQRWLYILWSGFSQSVVFFLISFAPVVRMCCAYRFGGYPARFVQVATRDGGLAAIQLSITCERILILRRLEIFTRRREFSEDILRLLLDRSRCNYIERKNDSKTCISLTIALAP
jgi:hypothetical protein